MSLSDFARRKRADAYFADYFPRAHAAHKQLLAGLEAAAAELVDDLRDHAEHLMGSPAERIELATRLLRETLNEPAEELAKLPEDTWTEAVRLMDMCRESILAREVPDPAIKYFHPTGAVFQEGQRWITRDGKGVTITRIARTLTTRFPVLGRVDGEDQHRGWRGDGSYAVGDYPLDLVNQQQLQAAE